MSDEAKQDETQLNWVRVKKAAYLDVVLNGVPHTIQQYRTTDHATGRREWVDVEIVGADPMRRTFIFVVIATLFAVAMLVELAPTLPN